MLQNQNEIFWFVALIVIVVLCLLIFFLAIMVKNYKVRQKADGDVKDAIISTQENEQNRIAEDLHDDIGPMLSAIKLQVSALSDADSSEVKSSLGQIENYMNQAINNVRAIARNLSSQLIVEYGLEQSLRDNIGIVSSLKKINIDLAFNMNNKELGPNQEINLYRIIREMLNNSVKHSNCENIQIVIVCDKNEILVQYKDDGKSKSGVNTSQSMGQINIRNRVNLLKGQIKEFTVDFSKGANYEFIFPTIN